MYYCLFADNEKPSISSTPIDVTQDTDGGSETAVVTWISPTASDNSGVVTMTSSNNDGDTFSIGVTTVTFTATDAAGNQATASFIINIEGMLIINCILFDNIVKKLCLIIWNLDQN